MKDVCDSCGKEFEEKEKEKENYWKNTDGCCMCLDCMNRPLKILRDVYTQIADFDEEFEESFLDVEETEEDFIEKEFPNYGDEEDES